MEGTLLSVVLGMEPEACSLLGRFCLPQPSLTSVLSGTVFLLQWELVPGEAGLRRVKPLSLSLSGPAQGVAMVTPLLSLSCHQPRQDMQANLEA